MDRFGNLEKIGEGGFGEVYKAIDKHTGKPCALKRIKEIDQSALDEVGALQQVKGHPNVINIQAYFIDRGSLWVVTDFCALGDLNRYFWDKQPDFNVRFRFMKQMSSAVAFLHARGIAHRDLKPENVLIGLDANAQPHAQLTDFGIAKIHCGEQMTCEFMTTCAGTAFFIAPEVLLSQFGGIYTAKADVFSLGVIFRAVVFERGLLCGDKGKYLVACFMVDGQPLPYSQAMVTDRNLKLTVTEDLLGSANARKLLDGMVHRDPNHRWSAEDVHKALSSLKAADFREKSTAGPSSHQSATASDTTTVKHAGGQLLSRLTSTVRTVKPSQSKQSEGLAAAKMLYDAIRSQFSPTELVALKQHILVLYVTISRNASPIDKAKLQQWVVPVIEGLEKIIRGVRLDDAETARFALGWLQFNSLHNK